MTWLDSPQGQAWCRHVLDEVVPMINSSEMTVAICPRGEPDIKFAVELGLSLLLGKPIVLVVHPGVQVPAGLVAVAREIVEVDLAAPQARERVTEAIQRIVGSGQ